MEQKIDLEQLESMKKQVAEVERALAEAQKSLAAKMGHFEALLLQHYGIADAQAKEDSPELLQARIAVANAFVFVNKICIGYGHLRESACHAGLAVKMVEVNV